MAAPAQAQFAQIGGVPVLILKEGSQRTVGREAQRSNILAAKVIAETIKTTLGPRGMDKMLVDSLGDVTITNDGATILKEIDIQHPAAKMLVEVAKTQDEEVGDGTTTVTVLAGELLKRAEALLDKEVHPTILISGYRKAIDKALEVLEKTSMKVSPDDVDTLIKVAKTAMGSKAIGGYKDYFAKLAVEAVKKIVVERDGKLVADIDDNIQLIKKQGGGALDTKLIDGIIVDKEVVHAGMPKRIENAKIALLDCPLEIEKPEIDAEIRITDPEEMKAFLDEEEKMLKQMVQKIKSIGADVVFCQKGVDDIAQHYLAKEGILTVRRVKKSDMEKLARATGARIVTNIEDLTPFDLGEAGLVEEHRIGEDRMVFVEKCKNPRAVSILIRAGLERAVDEAERTLTDALSVVSDVIEDGKVVPGGGAIELEIAKELRAFAPTVGGKEQLAIEAFADTLEEIPKTLAYNAGLDPIDILVEARAKHEEAGGFKYGVDVYSGKVADMFQLGIMEPTCVKRQAIKSAAEVASMILRIDDVIAAGKIESKTPTPKKEEEEKSETSID